MSSHNMYFFALVMATAIAQSAQGGTILRDAPEPSVPSASYLTTGQCWQNWLAKNGVHEGENILDDGRVLFVARAADVVSAKPGSGHWVVARNAVVGQLHLAALKSISDFIKVKIDGSSAAWLNAGPDTPPQISKALKAVSLAERARVLSGLKLDNEIRKFDPAWDGNGKTDAERRHVATLISSRFKQALSTYSELLAAGATTTVQCEGAAANDGTPTAGQYEVLTGVVWSARLSYVARALGRAGVTLEMGKNRKSLADRFSEFSAVNKNWLAMTLGTRVWTDENGEMVVVGFGAAPASTLKVLDEGRAQIEATAAVARFAGEALTAATQSTTAFQYKALANGAKPTFDTGAYRQKIQSVTKTVQLHGVYKIAEWRGKHPVSGAPMEVVAYAWKPSSSDAARAAERLLDPVKSGAQGQQGAKPMIAPVRAGANGSVSDY